VYLNEEDEKQFVSIVRTAKIKRRQFIVQPNFVCAHQTYVLKGAFRSYFVNDEGIEHTIQFAIEDWFISDFIMMMLKNFAIKIKSSNAFLDW